MSCRSGKIICLCAERWLKTGEPHFFASQDKILGVGIFREALASHPGLRAGERDKVAAVIRELTLAVVDLEARKKSLSDYMRRSNGA